LAQGRGKGEPAVPVKNTSQQGGLDLDERRRKNVHKKGKMGVGPQSLGGFGGEENLKGEGLVESGGEVVKPRKDKFRERANILRRERP